MTTAAVDQLKKCFVADPDTNLGIPIELTAADIRPYFEHQKLLLSGLPASDFASHLFDEGQHLPFSLPSDQLEEDRLEESRESVPVAVEEPSPAPPVLKPTPVTPAPKLHALQTPAELPPTEDLAPPAELVPEPPPPERRGRPPGS